MKFTLYTPYIVIKYYNMYKQDIIQNKIINVFGITLCTDEPKYIDEDSHYIHIPKSLFVKYINYINLNQICFELSNPINLTSQKIYLKKIEPSMNEFETNILLPDWVCKKLEIQICGEQVNFVPIFKPNIISRCKIRGSNSSYIKIDIKQLLEKKFNEFKCLNLNTVFTIGIVKFTIVELIDKYGENIQYGLTNNQLEIDFDVPDDIKFFERRKTLTEKINQQIDKKINYNNEFKKNFFAKKYGIFKFNEYIDKQNSYINQFNPNIDWDDIHSNLLTELEKEYFNNYKELCENKNILHELIVDGKHIQNLNLNKNNIQNLNKKSEKQIISNIFDNTIGYKLDDSNKSNILTKEEIKKARLEKIINK
jgi:hypothetical protein